MHWGREGWLYSPELYSPELCPPLPRYGFNSHGHAVVEHRLRARQETQRQLSSGEVACVLPAHEPWKIPAPFFPHPIAAVLVHACGSQIWRGAFREREEWQGANNVAVD